MKIKIDSKTMTDMIIDLTERGLNPHDYFEFGVDEGSTLVEGQTTLSEFTEPDEKPLENQGSPNQRRKRILPKARRR